MKDIKTQDVYFKSDKERENGFYNESFGNMLRDGYMYKSNMVVMTVEEFKHQITVKTKKSGCGICGGKLVEIRGRYPKIPKRKVCPTCTMDRLEQISEISSSNYGKTCKNDL